VKSKTQPAPPHKAKKDTLETMRYSLRLYITGPTLYSLQAIINLKRVCEKYLSGRYDIEVVDLYQQPELAREARLLATPTLIRKLPAPVRQVIGDLTSTERLLVALNLQKTGGNE
jgi:circadian clock protein KaiB